ncbi:hypothetical protein [Ferrovibrio terrae]|uniref:hypothetical protein n=1 Tax=Ferrovibrio terrae TaxID=2594003 RepID=UPI00313821E7
MTDSRAIIIKAAAAAVQHAVELLRIEADTSGTPINRRCETAEGQAVLDSMAAISDELDTAAADLLELLTNPPAPEGDDDSEEDRCSNPGGHEWPAVEEHERCLCIHCGADGDA